MKTIWDLWGGILLLAFFCSPLALFILSVYLQQ